MTRGVEGGRSIHGQGDELGLYIFNCGWFQCRPGFFIPGSEGPYVRSPVPAYLIDHPKGRAIFDTGLGPRFLRDPQEPLAPEKFGLQWFEGMDIASRLRAVDIDPGSIHWIVNSHLHMDHCGGNAQLPNAAMIVQRREWEAARANEIEGLYDASDYDVGMKVKLVDGEFDLFGDGRVTIVPTFGHSPGHQSLLVRMPTGSVLLAADCCYTGKNLDLGVLPGTTADPESAMATLQWLGRARSSGTRILFGHDAEQWKNADEGVRLVEPPSV